MTNEINKIELYGQNNDGDVRRFTVASGTAITKGSLMALTDPNTCILASSVCQPIAGIAAIDKDNNDYVTEISCWTNGIFDIVASGVITVGSPVTSSSTGSLNYVSGALGLSLAASGAALIGYAMETAADNERIRVRVRL